MRGTVCVKDSSHPLAVANVTNRECDESSSETLTMRPKLSSRLIKLDVVMLSKVHGNREQRHRHQMHRRARKFCFILLTLLILMVLYIRFFHSNNVRQEPLVDWGYNISLNVGDYILADNDTTIFEPYNICHKKVFIIIIVCSSVTNFASRQMIRETWGNTSTFNYNIFQQLHSDYKGLYLDILPERIEMFKDFMGESTNISGQMETMIPNIVIPVRVVFLLGQLRDTVPDGQAIAQLLQNEREQHDDIIQENFIDTYANLTIKSVMMLKWFKRRCLNASAFLMKSDDDTFVNIPNLLHYLLGGTLPVYKATLDSYKEMPNMLEEFNRLNATRSNVLVGYQFEGSIPVTDVKNKWYMPYYMFPSDVYPKYMSGACYIMSVDLVSRLYEIALTTSLIYLEDIFLTGVCAGRIKVHRFHNPLFNFHGTDDVCNVKGGITQHNVYSTKMADYYNFIIDASTKCPR